MPALPIHLVDPEKVAELMPIAEKVMDRFGELAYPDDRNSVRDNIIELLNDGWTTDEAYYYSQYREEVSGETWSEEFCLNRMNGVYMAVMQRLGKPILSRTPKS